MAVETIKDLIEHLQPDEQARLASWLVRRDMRAWDSLEEWDFSAGGDGLALQTEIDAAIDAGAVDGFKVSADPGSAVVVERDGLQGCLFAEERA